MSQAFVSFPHVRARRPRALARRTQRGLVLVVVLGVLGLLLLAGLGVLRTVDTGNVIAGNFSFQQAAVQASDRAVSDAITTMQVLVAGGNGNTAVANRYYSVRESALDARGFPSAINWNNVPCTNELGTAIADCSVSDGSLRVQYVVERLCTQSPVLTDLDSLRARCEFEATTTAATAEAVALRYRVLVRVRGPRNTDGWFEAVVSGPAQT